MLLVFFISGKVVWRWSLLCLLNKSNYQMSGLFVPPNHRRSKQQWAQTIYPSCQNPHTRHTKNMSPTFLLVTQFTQNNTHVLNFASEIWRSFHHTFNRRCRMIWTLPWHDETIINTILLHKTLHKKNTQHLQIVTMEYGTPPAMQCSSSRAYW